MIGEFADADLSGISEGVKRHLCERQVSFRSEGGSRAFHVALDDARRLLPGRSKRTYNFDRAHTGRLTKGRVPGEIVYGARKTRPAR